MKFFSQDTSETAAIVAEQSLVIRVILSAGPSGTRTGMASLATLEEDLIGSLTRNRAGEFDGSEFTEHEVFFYAYGPSADRLFAAVRPVLESFPIRPIQVLVRYGPYHDEMAPATVINI
ncbi:MAG: hypothetical protein HOQ05_03525 [Corynebacteriales bacterium]|nr:hypothetical protein [Mycobacteriales bacterium]